MPAPWRPGAPLRPSCRPQLGFPLAWGFLQAQYSSAEPRGPQRTGWRPDRPERRRRRRRGDKIAAPGEGSAGTTGKAREELPRGSKPVGSTPGMRRWACTQRLWLAVPRRAPFRGAVERGGDQAKPSLSLRARDSRWDLGSLGEGHGGVRDRGDLSLGWRGQDWEPQSRSLKASTSPPFPSALLRVFPLRMDRGGAVPSWAKVDSAKQS